MKKEIKTTTDEWFSEVCKKCGKQVESKSIDHTNYLMELHEASHSRKRRKKQ